MNIFAYSSLIFYFQLTYSSGNEIIDQVKCVGVVLKGGCPNKEVTFWLYNKNVQDYLLDGFNETTISNAPWVSNTKTVLILHGYTKNKSAEPNIWLKPEYMKKGYNIISADYSKAVPDPCYLQSVENVHKIGDCTAVFIETIFKKSNGEVKLTTFLVVGFSLGAHIAGKAGSELKKKENPITLDRIVALDPAFPLFYGPLNLITKKSASFVMIIHTNMFGRGHPEFTGHVDFVVNYGIFQPYCLHNISNPNAFIICNHDMAPQYYAESINSEKVFCGRFKKKHAIMGENTPSGTVGVFHVKTNKAPPFARDLNCTST